MGRPKKAARDVKKTLSIRMTPKTREMLEHDFDGSIQTAIDFFSVHHKVNMGDDKYRTKIKDYIELIRGA